MARRRSPDTSYKRWESHEVELPDGRMMSWTWDPGGPYPQISIVRFDGVNFSGDFSGPNGEHVSGGDIAAALLRELGHPHGELHAPFRGKTFLDQLVENINRVEPRTGDA